MRKVALMRWGMGAATLVLTAVVGTVPACAADQQPPRSSQGEHAPALRVVTAGDSITAGGPPWARQEISYPEALEATCGSDCKVRDVSHAGACLLLEGCYYPVRLRATLREQVWDRPEHPDVVVVMIGANDLGGYNPTEAFIRQLRGIRRDGRAAGVRVVFGTITPAHGFWPQRSEDQRQEVNAWIREQPGSIDFAGVLESQDLQLLSRYDSGDGLHPNARAYRAMGRAAWASLAE